MALLYTQSAASLKPVNGSTTGDLNYVALFAAGSHPAECCGLIRFSQTFHSSDRADAIILGLVTSTEANAQTVGFAGAQTTVGSGLNRPYAVAVDGAGDVFIADSGHNQVVKVPAGGGAQTTVGSGLSFPAGLAVDGAGDVFIADNYNSRLVEVPASGGTL